MQINPAHHLDRRLQEIDQEISTALRDIRRNLSELEKASSNSRSGTPATRPGNDFSAVLQATLDSGDESA